MERKGGLDRSRASDGGERAERGRVRSALVSARSLESREELEVEVKLLYLLSLPSLQHLCSPLTSGTGRAPTAGHATATATRRTGQWQSPTLATPTRALEAGSWHGGLTWGPSGVALGCGAPRCTAVPARPKRHMTQQVSPARSTTDPRVTWHLVQTPMLVH